MLEKLVQILFDKEVMDGDELCILFGKYFEIVVDGGNGEMWEG